VKAVLNSHPHLLDLLHDSVILTDFEGFVTDCNLAAERLYEYPRAELIGMHVVKLYPEDLIPLAKSVTEEIHTKGSVGTELRNRTKTGKEIWIHLSVSLLRDDHGVPYGMIGFSIDITKQKVAEEARREADEINRAARAAARVGTWHWDLLTNHLWWDQTSCALLGLPEEVNSGYDKFVACVHPSDRDRVADAIRSAIDSGKDYDEEYRIVHSDGAMRWLLARGRCHRDQSGVPTRLLGVATDITDRKHAELQLEKERAKYKVLSDSPHIGIAAGTLEKFTDVNETFCKLTGYSREELLSGAVRWEDMTPPEYLEVDYAALQEMTLSGVAKPWEKEYRRKDGSLIRVLMGSQLLSREPLEWGCFALDISQQHQALAAVRSAEQLASAAKMGSSLAHEINNPLAALTNVLYLLQYSRSDKQRDELLTSAQESLGRVTKITRQMIGIYSDSAKISEFKINDIVDDTIAAYSTRSRAKSLRFLARNEMVDRSVTGVESEFRRLMSALVENAVEHSDVGGTLYLHVKAAHEWRGQRRPGIRIIVRDSGSGIPREKIETMFEPFQSTKTQRGSGLGLWVSRSIAEKHGGRVTVRSSTRPGFSGTCVSVFLPEYQGQRISVASGVQ